MQDIQPELIEKYQILLQQDPKSQVFAPLTEAYRKMGLIDEAFRIAIRGVQFNPNFGGGRVALAKILLERDSVPSALEELEKAIELSPDNILAHSLAGDCYLRSRKPKEALRSYKMVLFLAPNNEKAQKAVRKLESLTADEYEEDLFEMRPLSATPQTEELAVPLKPLSSTAVTSELDRVLSLTDAYIARNDYEKATQVLEPASREFGNHAEIVRRMKLLKQRHLDVSSPSQVAEVDLEPPPNRQKMVIHKQIELLQNLLVRVRSVKR